MDSSNNRVLVAYATHTGSTADIARAVGKTLGECGFAVDVRAIVDHPAVEEYAAVVIGSGVNHANWLPEAVEFVRANQIALNRVPVALFTVHIQNRQRDAASTKKRLAYLDAVRPLLHPVDEVFFAGRFNREGAKLMLPLWMARFVPTIDLRNWQQIHAWAESLAGTLQHVIAEPAAV